MSGAAFVSSRPAWKRRRGMCRSGYCQYVERRYYSSELRHHLLNIEDYVVYLRDSGTVDRDLLVKHSPSFNVLAYTGPFHSVQRRIPVEPSAPSWFENFLYQARSARLIGNPVDNATEQLKFAKVSLDGEPITADSLNTLRVNGESTPLVVEFSARQRLGTWHPVPATDPRINAREAVAEKMRQNEEQQNAKRKQDTQLSSAQLFHKDGGLSYYSNSDRESPLVSVAANVTGDFVGRFISGSCDSEMNVKQGTTKTAVFKSAVQALTNKENYAPVCAGVDPSDFWKKCGAQNPLLCMSDIANSITSSAMNTPLHGVSSHADAEELLKTNIIGDGIFATWVADLKSMASRLVHCGTARYELRGDYGLQYVDPDTDAVTYPQKLAPRGERHYMVSQTQGGPMFGVVSANPDYLNSLYQEMRDNSAISAETAAAAVLPKGLRPKLLSEKSRIVDTSSRFNGGGRGASAKKQTVAVAPEEEAVAAQTDAIPSVVAVQMSTSESFKKDIHSSNFTLLTINNSASAFPSMSQIEKSAASSSELSSLPKLEQQVDSDMSAAAAASSTETTTTTTKSTGVASIKPRDRRVRPSVATAPATTLTSSVAASNVASTTSTTDLPDLFSLASTAESTDTVMSTPSSRVVSPAKTHESVLMSFGPQFHQDLVANTADHSSCVVLYPANAQVLNPADLQQYVFAGDANQQAMNALVAGSVDQCNITSAANESWTVKDNGNDGFLAARSVARGDWKQLRRITVVEAPTHLSFRLH
jgi:hypothetical protein